MESIQPEKEFAGKKIKKVLFEFQTCYPGWECDPTGWIVLFYDGTKEIILTDHHRPFIGKTEDLVRQIEDCNRLKYSLEEAINIFTRGE